MSLQDDVNNQVSVITAQLADAQAVSLPPAATVSFDSIRTALGEVANAIDLLGGDSGALRASIETIEDAEIDLSAVVAASGSHLGATVGLAGLLITQSNFDGSSQ